MDMEQIALKLQETTDRSLRNEGRIKKLESENSTLHKLATSVAVMAEQLKTMNTNFSNLTLEVEELRGRPGRRWNHLVDAIIVALCAAVIGYLVGKI